MVYTYTGAVAYDRLGSSWRTAAGLRSVSVTDPATGLLPANLIQGGLAVTWLTADANSRYSFTCDVPGVVVDFGAGSQVLYANEVPGLAIAAGGATTTAIDAHLGGDATGLVTVVAGKIDTATASSTYAQAFLPEKYGADNTGTTDARAGIQAAIEAALAAGGGDVIIDGTYRIDTSLTPRSNVALIGRGWGRSIIKLPSSWSSGSALQVGGTTVSPVEHFTVRGIKFDLSDVPVGVLAKGIFCTYMRDLRFEDNWILNSTATGMGADYLDGGIIRGNRVEGCGRSAVGNEVAALGCAGIGIGTGGWGSEATLVEGNFVLDAARYGIFVELGVSGSVFTSGVKIINNQISGCYWGIGSDGVAWSHIVGNTVESSTQDGISISPGNTGGASYGDLITLNTVRLSGRYGLYVDMTTAGAGSPTDRGKFMIVNNRFINGVGVGVKFANPTVLSGVQIVGNRISGNGSIGLAVTSAGLTESDILNNRITDNVGPGMQFSGTQSKVRIKGNRCGDTRATGKTQTYGIDLYVGNTFTDFEIAENDAKGNSVAALNLAGTLATCVVRNNAGHNPQGWDALTPTASPWTYVAGTTEEVVNILNGTVSNVAVTGATGSVNVALAAPCSIPLMPGDTMVVTYSVLPAVKRLRK